MNSGKPVLFFQILLLGILVVIALNTEWLYDEAWTYSFVEKYSLTDIILYRKFQLANNHVINSGLFALLQKSGMKHVFFYRVINIACFWIYISYISKILRQNNVFSFLNIVTFCLFPFIASFVSGRGYAIALTAFMVCLYYYNEYNRQNRSEYLLLFILFGSLSSLSIFSFIFGFAALCIVLLSKRYLTFIQNKKQAACFLLILPVGMYVFVMGKIISSHDVNIIGTESLLKNGALSSIVSYICLNQIIDDKWFFILKMIFIVSSLPLALLLVKKHMANDYLIIIMVSILLLVLSHFLLNAKYPLERGLMYLIPLLYIYVLKVSNNTMAAYIHQFALLMIGVVNLGILTYRSFMPDIYDAMKYVNEYGKSVVVLDNYNPNIALYNKLYFHDAIKIYSFHTAKDDSAFLSFISKMNNNLLISPEDLSRLNLENEFSLKLDLQKNQFSDLFIRKQ